MAIYYSDNLLGNDTTGSGTAGSPWKSITKALTACATGDTIRVAGSGFTAIAGTLTITSNSAIIATSVSQVGIIAVGTLISINDPILGNRTGLHRVTAVTATNITVITNLQFSSGTYTGEFLTQNHYATATASQNLEDFNTIAAVTAQNIEIQGGWTNGFASQNGITGVSYTAVSGNSGTIFRNTTGPAIGGYTFNNFAFSGLQPWNGTKWFTAIPSNNYFKLGNIWFLQVSGGTQINCVEATTGCNLYLNSATQFTLGDLSSINVPQKLTINTLYVISNPGNNAIQTNAYSTVVNNLWMRAWDANGFFTATVRTPTSNGTWTIVNYNIAWTAPLATAQFQALFANGYNTVQNVNQYGTYPSTNPLFRPLAIRTQPTAQVQVLMPTQNISTVIPNMSTAAYVASILINGTQSTCPVRDIEGDKQIIGCGTLIQADSTEFSTGTNSLKLRRDSGKDNNDNSRDALVDISSFYLPELATPKTITIRAKASANTTANFLINKNGEYGAPSQLVTQPAGLRQSFSLTTSWADYTFTPLQNQSNVDLYAGSYAYLAVSMASNLSAEYIWIDSVTIS
jgi:hypothetical protein